VCSADPAHTAHLTCWATWAADDSYAGFEHECPVLLCTGSATCGAIGDATAVKNAILQKMQDLGLSAQGSSTMTSYAAEDYVADYYPTHSPPVTQTWLDDEISPLPGYDTQNTGTSLLGSSYDENAYPSSWQEDTQERPRRRRRLNEEEPPGYSTVAPGELFPGPDSPGTQDYETDHYADTNFPGHYQQEPVSSDSDGEDGTPQPSVMAPQATTATILLDCAICAEDFELVDGDYQPGEVWWCSGSAEDRRKYVYCTTCKNRIAFCNFCAHTLSVASLRNPPVAQVYQFPFQHEINGCRGTGKPQTGMLCYAAATATAILWGTRQDLSIYECMHHFAMSVQSNGIAVFDRYRLTYTALVSMPAYAQLSVANIITQIFQVYPEYTPILDAACGEFGTPVFPANVANQLHYQSITTNDLSAAIQQGKPVIKGEGNHWTVIFGVRGNGQNDIAYISVYDPMTNSYKDVNWVPATRADYYVVG